MERLGSAVARARALAIGVYFRLGKMEGFSVCLDSPKLAQENQGDVWLSDFAQIVIAPSAAPLPHLKFELCCLITWFWGPKIDWAWISLSTNEPYAHS